MTRKTYCSKTKQRSLINIVEENNTVCGEKQTTVNRWEVENSWSTKGPANGYYMMTDKWFSEYLFGGYGDVGKS